MPVASNFFAKINCQATFELIFKRDRASMTKQELIQLLADNELDKLFGLLREHLSKYPDLVLLEGQWRDLQARIRSGVLSNEQANLEAAKVRKSLLELVEIITESPIGRPMADRQRSVGTQPAGQSQWSRRAILLGGGAVLIVVLAFWFSRSFQEEATPERQGPAEHSAPAPKTADQKAARSRSLNTSDAAPLTFSAGDSYYERVYSVVEGKVESIGGGRSLVTLKVGLQFKGSINWGFSSDNFRLIAPELRGPQTPANFFADVVDSRSYAERDVKFEIADSMTRFSVFLEGKEDRAWAFSVE